MKKREKMLRETHRITIVEAGKGFLVRPACLALSPGDTVHFRNLTRLGGRVVFPYAGVLDPSPTDGCYPIPSGGRVDVNVMDRGGRGAFPYGVLLEEAGEYPKRLFASGESAPHLIIE